MKWEAWVLIGWLVAVALVGVQMIGKQREVITTGGATFNLLVCGFLAWLVWRLAR